MRVAVIADPGPEWDAFVEAEPAGQLGHVSAWARVVREAYGLTPVYLEARNEQGAIAGILPLVRFRGLSGGLELISMPFLDSGGILTQDPATRCALLDTALELTRAQRASALELRELAAGNGDPAGQARVGLVLALESGEDAQWRALRAKVRNQIRKAAREGLSIAPRNAPTLLADFYGPFCRNMRDLGSPVHSKRFFSAAAEAFGDRLRFIVSKLGEKPVGGLVAIHFAGALSVPWGVDAAGRTAPLPEQPDLLGGAALGDRAGRARIRLRSLADRRRHLPVQTRLGGQRAPVRVAAIEPRGRSTRR